jgi:hypothetical protein
MCPSGGHPARNPAREYYDEYEYDEVHRTRERTRSAGSAGSAARDGAESLAAWLGASLEAAGSTVAHRDQSVLEGERLATRLARAAAAVGALVLLLVLGAHALSALWPSSRPRRLRPPRGGARGYGRVPAMVEPMHMAPPAMWPPRPLSGARALRGGGGQGPQAARQSSSRVLRC